MTMENPQIEGKNIVGSLVGKNNGSVENCSVSGTGHVRAILDPDLLWIVGMPIRDPETGVLLGTFNLDGLRITKDLYALYDLSFDLYDDVHELGKLMRKIL